MTVLVAGVTGGESLAVFIQFFIAGKHELSLHRVAVDNVVSVKARSLSLFLSLTMTP